MSDSLPVLPGEWQIGLSLTEAHRGTSGRLLPQALQIIGNLHYNVDKNRAAFVRVLGMRPHTTSARVVAKLCGINRNRRRMFAAAGSRDEDPCRAQARPVSVVGFRGGQE